MQPPSGNCLCDDSATTLSIFDRLAQHQPFGDISRHNLTLKQDAWHAGADASLEDDATFLLHYSALFPLTGIGMIWRRKPPER
jgi:hypothetical protein